MDVQTPDNNTHSLHTIYIKTLAVSGTKTGGAHTRIGIIENAGYARNCLTHKEQFVVEFVRMREKKKKQGLTCFENSSKQRQGTLKNDVFITSTAKKFGSSSRHSLQTAKRV